MIDFSDIAEDEETQGDDETPEVDEDEEPVSKLGEMYELGNSILMCGDSTSEEDVNRLINGSHVDMIFTDPPYGMNLDTDFSSMKSKSKDFAGKQGNKYAQGIVDDFEPKMIELILSLDVKETFLWGADYFAELLPEKNNGSWIVWDKRANGNDDIKQDESSDKMYGSCFELCWSKNKHKRDIARIKWAGIFGTSEEFDHKRYHPTQKPTNLCKWFLDRYSKKGDTVLDLFGGSGSTLISCEMTGRKNLSMELDPHYCDVIRKRYTQWAKQNNRPITSGCLE